MDDDQELRDGLTKKKLYMERILRRSSYGWTQPRRDQDGRSWNSVSPTSMKPTFMLVRLGHCCWMDFFERHCHFNIDDMSTGILSGRQLAAVFTCVGKCSEKSRDSFGRLSSSFGVVVPPTFAHKI